MFHDNNNNNVLLGPLAFSCVMKHRILTFYLIRLSTYVFIYGLLSGETPLRAG